jgi:hypothetical protein
VVGGVVVGGVVIGGVVVGGVVVGGVVIGGVVIGGVVVGGVVIGGVVVGGVVVGGGISNPSLILLQSITPLESKVILFSIFIQVQELQEYTLQVIQLIVVYQIIIFIKLQTEAFRALIMEFTFLILQDFFKY